MPTSITVLGTRSTWPADTTVSRVSGPFPSTFAVFLFNSLKSWNCSLQTLRSSEFRIPHAIWASLRAHRLRAHSNHRFFKPSTPLELSLDVFCRKFSIRFLVLEISFKSIESFRCISEVCPWFLFCPFSLWSDGLCARGDALNGLTKTANVEDYIPALIDWFEQIQNRLFFFLFPCMLHNNCISKHFSQLGFYILWICLCGRDLIMLEFILVNLSLWFCRFMVLEIKSEYFSFIWFPDVMLCRGIPRIYWSRSWLVPYFCIRSQWD